MSKEGADRLGETELSRKNSVSLHRINGGTGLKTINGAVGNSAYHIYWGASTMWKNCMNQDLHD